ncbi:MAG: glycosyltransferase family 4 protein, partial [Rivularia sp. ALOHA_DT_140]|nr:glycosyltransferase family 4 protein [Rivularia sp. ALOHA_DT_140]
MKILINCINLLSGSQGAGGAGKYVYYLISELAKNLNVTVRVLVNPSNFSLFNKIPRLEVIPLLDNNVKGIHDNLSWSNIYFCPLNELVPNYIDSRVPIVSTILDLQHESYPHFFKKDIYESRRVGYGYAISRSDAIITISNHEKSLIEKIYGKKEVYVTYLAGYLASEYTSDFLDNIDITDVEKKIPKEPYIIYPAIPWQHKNHYRLIESIWILKREFPQFKDLKLVLTGAQKHILKSSHFQRIISDLEMEDSIEVRGFVSDLELAILIKKAKFMIFPSLYEGFGIPLIDAMSFGTPALTTSLSCIPEVCSEGVEYLSD